MPVIQIPYKPRYPEVHAVIEQSRFCVLVAHRRFGKTVLAVNHLIRSALTSRRPGSNYAYIAPFRNQGKSVAWDYIKSYTRPIPGRSVNESELSVRLPSQAGQARVRIFGADNPDALRGLYFDGVILDEVAQMKPDVWEEIIQPALADRQGYAVFIGTPKGVNIFSRLYHHALKEQAAGSKLWAALCYPVDKTQALPPAEVERLRNELSPNKFRQEMLCDFTASADDTLITIDQVSAAIERKPDMKLASQWPLVIGVDVARFGADATVFFPRRGPVAMNPQVITKRDTMDVAAMLLKLMAELKPQAVCIDQGQGQGVIDLVRHSASGVGVHEIPFGGKALDEKHYANRRAEMWASMAEWLKSGCLPKGVGENLKAELASPGYHFDPQGRLCLEAKEEIKKRLKHSTDLGDALALTFAVRLEPLMPSQPRRRLNGGAAYNPFGDHYAFDA